MGRTCGVGASGAPLLGAAFGFNASTSMASIFRRSTTESLARPRPAKMVKRTLNTKNMTAKVHVVRDKRSPVPRAVMIPPPPPPPPPIPKAPPSERCIKITKMSAMQTMMWMVKRMLSSMDDLALIEGRHQSELG